MSAAELLLLLLLFEQQFLLQVRQLQMRRQHGHVKCGRTSWSAQRRFLDELRDGVTINGII